MKIKLITITIAFVLVGLLAQNSQAQIFSRIRSASNQNCPNGVCPTNQGTQWYNRDGLTPRAHVEHTHGMNTEGMSHTDVLQAQNDYHNTYGSGHPVQGFSTINKITTTTTSCAGSKTSCSGTQNIPTATASIANQAETFATSERRKCIKAVMQAARQARDNGKCTSFDVATLSILSRSPASMAKIQAVIHETAIEEGLATATAIDWDALIAFIEKLIPLIIKLIGLFGDSSIRTMSYSSDTSYFLAA